MTFIEQRLHLMRWMLSPREVHPTVDRGDVPGWVLVTIMTAGLVAALWAVAGGTLVDVFQSAIADTVGGP